jgi:GntR family transcriptional regulator
MLRQPFDEEAWLLEQAPLPLYHQVKEELRARIDANEFAPGVALPTEEQICAEYRVSRITVRRALDELIGQGLITKRHGIGSFVAERKDEIRAVRLVGSLSEFLTTAEALNTRLISVATVDPTEEVILALALKQKQTVTRVQVLASLESRPVGFLNIYVSNEVGKSINLDSFKASEVLIRRIERMLAKHIVRAEQTIGAGIAGAEAANLLGLAADAPTLKVKRVYYERSGQPIEVVLVDYHPDRYQFNVEFVERNIRRG